MNLPPRLEGPHAWLWRLVFREAESLVSRSDTPSDRDEAADWLWRGIVSGWIWIRRSRDGISWAEPDRWLHELVSAEATRHLALSDTRGAEPPRPRAERHAVIMGHIWRYLSTGWARVADEDETVLFWHPGHRRFEPFTAELEADYRRMFKSLRHVGAAAERRLAGAQPYTGGARRRQLPETRSAYTGGPSGRRRGCTPPPEPADEG